MKPGSSHAERSLIGMLGFCARMPRIAVIESVASRPRPGQP
jgi:hypothetical protein